MAKAWGRNLHICLYYGKKGSGKSLFQAYIAKKLFREYEKTEKRYPSLPKRAYWSSQKFSKEIEAKELGKHLFYWENPRQLYGLRNIDIGWDEIGKDLPAGSWGDTPKKLKQVFSHLRKRGNRLFANTQIYEDIDISFRRQIDRAFKIEKIIGSKDISATLPPPRFVWGIIRIREFDPQILENMHDETERELTYKGFPRYIFITKKLVAIYDTQMELPPYLPDSLEHIEYLCLNKNCVKSTPGHGHIEHKKI